MADEVPLRKVVEFLQKSELVNLDMPLSRLVREAGELEAVGQGEVFFWSQWLVITHCPASAIIAIGESANVASEEIQMGEAPARAED